MEGAASDTPKAERKSWSSGDKPSGSQTPTPTVRTLQQQQQSLTRNASAGANISGNSINNNSSNSSGSSSRPRSPAVVKRDHPHGHPHSPVVPPPSPSRHPERGGGGGAGTGTGTGVVGGSPVGSRKNREGARTPEHPTKGSGGVGSGGAHSNSSATESSSKHHLQRSRSNDVVDEAELRTKNASSPLFLHRSAPAQDLKNIHQRKEIVSELRQLTFSPPVAASEPSSANNSASRLELNVSPPTPDLADVQLDSDSSVHSLLEDMKSKRYTRACTYVCTCT